jgi:probable selenium-dependent hydroxylase accessory protein YqeC
VPATRSLLDAFPAEPGSVLALAGGGGKTSLMWSLARALSARGRRVLSTTTTRIYPPGPDESPTLLLLEEALDGLDAVRRRLASAPHCTVAARPTPDGKLQGVPPTLVDEAAAARLAEVVIVEADGSASRPLKAAREGEPVFPASTTHAILLMGIEALGAPLDEARVFRSALAAEITGLALGAPVTPEAAAALLLGPRGLARDAPRACRLLVYVNKVESPEQEERAQALVPVLFEQREPRLVRVVLGSLTQGHRGFAVWDRMEPG